MAEGICQASSIPVRMVGVRMTPAARITSATAVMLNKQLSESLELDLWRTAVNPLGYLIHVILGLTKSS